MFLPYCILQASWPLTFQEDSSVSPPISPIRVLEFQMPATSSSYYVGSRVQTQIISLAFPPLSLLPSLKRSFNFSLAIQNFVVGASTLCQCTLYISVGLCLVGYFHLPVPPLLLPTFSISLVQHRLLTGRTVQALPVKELQFPVLLPSRTVNKCSRGGWKDCSVVQGTCCSCRKPEFDFQHLHNGTHPAVTPVLRNLTASFVLNREPDTHMVHIHIYMQTKYSYMR